MTIVKDHPDMLLYMEWLQSKNSDALGFLPRMAFEQHLEAGRAFLGLLNGSPCGYIIVGSGYRGVLRCWQVCIQYDTRRRLYGAMLVAASEEYGESLGCTVSVVHCASDLAANEFWADMGYMLAGAERAGESRRHCRHINIWHKKLTPSWVATHWDNGRPRIYPTNAARQAAYRLRQKAGA